MTFTLRSALIVMVLVSLWMGALVSRSSLAIELVSNLSALLILLTLPLAIWDPRREMRPFWTGFFVVGLGNLLFAICFVSNQQAAHLLAELIVGRGEPLDANYELAWTSVRFGGSSFASRATAFGARAIPYNAVRGAMPVLISLVVGCVGGWVTGLVSRSKPLSGS